MESELLFRVDWEGWEIVEQYRLKTLPNGLVAVEFTLPGMAYDAHVAKVVAQAPPLPRRAVRLLRDLNCPIARQLTLFAR